MFPDLQLGSGVTIGQTSQVRDTGHGTLSDGYRLPSLSRSLRISIVDS